MEDEIYAALVAVLGEEKTKPLWDSIQRRYVEQDRLANDACLGWNELVEKLQSQLKILEPVLNEREYQRQKWGTEHDRSHTLEEWLTILTVYVGKLGQETVVYHGRRSMFIKRLTQIAAISVAALEALNEPDPTRTE